MASVRIITDATAHLSPSFVAEHQIGVLPVEVHFGDDRFLIGPDSDPKLLFQRMAEETVKPMQVRIPASALERTYDRLHREAQDILVILSSGKLSNGIAKAQSISRAYMGRSRITVMDSMTTSWGLGLVVEAAARAAAQGVPLEAIVRLIRGIIPHVYVVFFVERLDYLEQGRRIDPGQALLGTLLRIRPILLLEGGEIIPQEKVRTRAMALDKLADFVAEFAAVQNVVIMRSPLNGDTENMISELTLRLDEVLPAVHFPIMDYDPVLACHIGPQALGVTVYEGA